MKVRVAEPTGLCFGVRRAIRTVEEALARCGSVWAIGSPIHNPQEVARLCRMGLKLADSEEEVPQGAAAFIRAHGVPPEVLSRLAAKNCAVIDGTCPFVRNAQIRARELSEQGYHLLVLGNEKHPEIVGILGHVRGPYTVISSDLSFEEFDKNCLSTKEGKTVKIRKLGLVSQTTQEEHLLAEAAREALSRTDELRVCNTICRATVERQGAVAALARSVDGMIVIGGHDSANTGKLCSISRASGCETLWIEEASQLDALWVQQRQCIGIAAGASTPDWLIEELKNAITNIAGRQGDVSYE